MPLTINKRPLGTGEVLELHGFLDSSTVPQLEAQVTKILDAGQKLLFFDLRHLNFVSSSGLSVFLVAFRRLQNTGAVRFFGLTDPVRLIFNTAGLTLRLDIFDTEEQAAAAPLPGKKGR